MPNAQNLKSYRKGQSGNLGGRPRGAKNVSTVLANMLQDEAPDIVVEASFINDISRGMKSVTIADAAAARIVYQGVVMGEPWALRELLDRTEGKPKQSIEMSDPTKIEPVVLALQNAWKQYKEFCEINNIEYPSQEALIERINNVANERNLDANLLRERVLGSSEHESEPFG